jgi:hypothetical protein
MSTFIATRLQVLELASTIGSNDSRRPGTKTGGAGESRSRPIACMDFFTGRAKPLNKRAEALMSGPMLSFA